MIEVISSLLIFLCIVLWLGMAGYAVGRGIQDKSITKSEIGSLVGLSLFLAPFMFVVALVLPVQKRDQ